MTIQEFINLTGIYPTSDFYKAIEEAYYNYDGNKQEFCSAYKQNKEGLAEWIARNYDQAAREAREALEAQQRRTHEEMRAKQAEVTRLKEALEKEQEWVPYEDPHNVKQADYERLQASGAKELTDEEARDIIAKEFGFERSKITIVREVFKTEINRHRQVRRVGTYSRKPLFDVWDWNYIVFNIRGNCTMGYEMYNGQLQMYWA